MIGAYVAAAERKDDVIVVEVEYRDGDLVRSIPGARYKSDEHRWHVPLTWAGFLTLYGVLGHRLDVGPHLSEWYTETVKNQIEPALALRERIEVGPDTPSPYLGALAELNRYHRWGV